jgi:SagB-type dehydrogenase family enzyme
VIIVQYLLAARLLVQAEDLRGTAAPRFEEDTDPALRGWTPVDLMFHTRSTTGRHDNDFGVTFPWGRSSADEPVVRPVHAGESLQLPRPRWDGPEPAVPFPAVLEASRASRRFGTGPVDLPALGDLLYRTARIRSLVGSPDPAAAEATSDRPYLSSTGTYALELYLAVRHCVGVAQGVYHYDPLEHRLHPLRADAEDLAELHEAVRVEANLDGPAAAVLVITARFRRLSRVYAGPPYALVLKDAGMLTQALALACTALDLAFCGLWSVNIESTARVLGTDWRTEPVVGGLVIGPRPAPEPDEKIADNGTWYAVNDAEWVTRARDQLRRA